jgi:hypothetical protein
MLPIRNSGYLSGPYLFFAPVPQKKHGVVTMDSCQQCVQQETFRLNIGNLMVI